MITIFHCPKCSGNFKKVTKTINKNRFQFINGKRWSVNVGCPNCDKYYESKSVELLGDEVVPMYHSRKVCSGCNGKLELSRWKYCTKCKKNAGDSHLESFSLHA